MPDYIFNVTALFAVHSASLRFRAIAFKGGLGYNIVNVPIQPQDASLHLENDLSRRIVTHQA